MAINVTQDDIEMLYRDKIFQAKLELLERNSNGSFSILDTLTGIISGSYSENADSDVRRTLSLELTIQDGNELDEYKKIWIDKYVRVYIGYTNVRTKEIMWYKKGIYIFDSCDVNNSISSASISVSCSDLVSTLDGTHSGQIDTTKITITAGTVIRDALISIITQFGNIVNYRIDDMGKYTCLEGVTSDYLIRRASDTTWNQTPYELEFDVGCTVWDVVVALRDLYPSTECFFDEDGVFVCQRIPTLETDSEVLSTDICTKLRIDERSNTDLSTVRNVTRVYGKAIEVDRYFDSPTYQESTDTSLNPYLLQVDDFDGNISNGEIVGIKVERNIGGKFMLVIGDFTTISGTNSAIGAYVKKRVIETTATNVTSGLIVSDNTPSEQIETTTTVTYEDYDSDYFKDGQVYCFKYAKCIASGETESQYYWLYVGQYQVQAICSNEEEGTSFCIQNIGERLQVLSGTDYDTITDDDTAYETASYENWKSSRLTDTITINLLDIPFLQVNTKIGYQLKGKTTSSTYIVKSISENFGDGTISITATKFYRLYPNFLGSGYTSNY